MPRLPLIAAALAAAALAAVPAPAQYALPSVQMTAKVTPARAGTTARPRAARLRMNVTVARAAHASPSQVALLLPRHARLSTAGFPRNAQVGSGLAAFAFDDTAAVVRFDVRLLATASRSTLVLRFRERDGSRAFAARALLRRSRAPFSQKLTIAVPAELAAPAHITGLSLSLGATRRRRHALTVRGCPGDRVHRTGVRLSLPSGSAEARAQSACRPS